MDVVYERCCGLDIHKRTVVACLLTPGAMASRSRTCAPSAPSRTNCWRWRRGWRRCRLHARGHGEHRGLLEAGLEPVGGAVRAAPGQCAARQGGAGAQDRRQGRGVAGRPAAPRVAARQLRARPAAAGTAGADPLPHEPGPGATAEVNRLQKTLEGANIKLADVATDIVGVSGRRMLAGADRRGRPTRRRWPSWPRASCGASGRRWSRALRGQIGPHQRFLLAQQLAHIEQLEATIAAVSAEIEERLRPFEDDTGAAGDHPGVGRRTAQVLLAEIGTDMSRFPTHRPSGRLGGDVPGQRRERRQAPQRQDAQRQSLAARRPDRSGACRRAE